MPWSELLLKGCTIITAGARKEARTESYGVPKFVYSETGLILLHVYGCDSMLSPEQFT